MKSLRAVLKLKQACKPVFVFPPGGNSIIYLVDLPVEAPFGLDGPPYPQLIWSFNPQGLPPARFPGAGVGSYPAFSPLPRVLPRGGIFSVALSVVLPLPAEHPRILRGGAPCVVRTFLRECARGDRTACFNTKLRKNPGKRKVPHRAIPPLEQRHSVSCYTFSALRVQVAVIELLPSHPHRQAHDQNKERNIHQEQRQIIIP